MYVLNALKQLRKAAQTAVIALHLKSTYQMFLKTVVHTVSTPSKKEKSLEGVYKP